MPKREVSIDENLIDFEGQASAIPYMANKHHHRFGFKHFCLCECSTCYTVNFSIYERKNNTASQYGTSNDVCIQLVGPLLGMGYHLYSDKLDTAVPLDEALLLLYKEIESIYPKVSNKNYRKEFNSIS